MLAPGVCALLGLLATFAMAGCGESETPVTPPVESALPDPSAEPPAAPVPPEIAALSPRYRELHSMLESADVLMEWKHEIVLDDLAPDESAEATAVLILGTINTSIPVSMASLKALASRMDDRVEVHFVSLLENDSWERRAWSARILGQTGRAGALIALGEILQGETDPRVRRQVEQAIATLEVSHPAAEAARGPEAAVAEEAGG